ncbi:protein rep [Paenibacillus sp. DMB5]|uniref:protein rep n=1 Tax=Paenibacillus sp. DMB5 TaxID=1780103 RepID=UPI00076D50D0|nr:protein rep [Paenibacillus sp. DMB5]KUP24268.1 hypothetical protein AWJ19_13710 [Paenibacillus sp. DMB5]
MQKEWSFCIHSKLKSFEVEAELLSKVNKNIKQNELIIQHYKRLYGEQTDSSSKWKTWCKIERISGCNRFWRIDNFSKQAVKDYLGTSTCKEKFCSNCKKLKQASRMSRFIPYIEECSTNNQMFHLVLTIPSVKGTELLKAINEMFSAFSKLNRYIRGDKKIKGISFENWGYLGGLRSLEVTYKQDNYHPHLHCLLICENNFLSDKTERNVYSLKRGKMVRKFSLEEIIIQKIWLLLITGQTVTLKNIENVELGYSCMIDKFRDEDYGELFKYITKNDNGKMTYAQFNVLRESLHSKRQIQGYGVLHRISDDHCDETEEQVEAIYAEIRRALESVESPLKESVSPKQLLSDSSSLLISKKKIYSYLRQGNCETFNLNMECAKNETNQ